MNNVNRDNNDDDADEIDEYGWILIIDGGNLNTIGIGGDFFFGWY